MEVYGGLEAHCRLVDEEIVEVWSSGAMEARRRCSNKEAWRYGGGLQACRRGGICFKSSGAPEAGCRCVDVEVFASRAPELWRFAAGM